MLENGICETKIRLSNTSPAYSVNHKKNIDGQILIELGVDAMRLVIISDKKSLLVHEVEEQDIVQAQNIRKMVVHLKAVYDKVGLEQVDIVSKNIF